MKPLLTEGARRLGAERPMPERLSIRPEPPNLSGVKERKGRGANSWTGTHDTLPIRRHNSGTARKSPAEAGPSLSQ